MVMIEARTGLLDVLDALDSQRKSVVLVGAQAIYLHTSNFKSPVAEFTKDADLAFLPELLSSSPLIEEALTEAGFVCDPKGQPGRWISLRGIPVDFMVPEKLVGHTKRSAGIAPHAKNTARNTRGIEGCLVDNQIQKIVSHDPKDTRTFEILVAGPSALLIAKIIKISERLDGKRPLEDKDAHDIYRLLAAIPADTFVSGLTILKSNELSQEITRIGLAQLGETFADGPDAEGSRRAGQAEYGVGDPETVAQSVSLLAKELLEILN